jgi:UDP-glucose 4-epimerase
MKVLVTGGCGFIGSHLVDGLIAAKHEVVIVDNLLRGRYLWDDFSAKPRLEVFDIEDHANLLRVFNEVQPHMVFHLAAHHYIPFCEKNPYEAFSTNVTGTLNVLDACSKTHSVQKFFYASTGDVYAPCGYAHREIDMVSPVYVYGETKLIGEQAVRRYKSSVGVPFDIVIGRLFNAAGSRETNPHFLPEVVRQLDAGVKVIEVGNTWPMRDFVDVRSMANRIQAITERIVGIDVFNIGSGKAQSVQHALDVLTEVHGQSVQVVSVDERKRPNDRPFLCPSVDKLSSILGAACKSFDAETARNIWAEPSATRLLYTAAK